MTPTFPHHNAANPDHKQHVLAGNPDLPWYQRYWNWLVGVSKCVTLNCDLGLTRNGVNVNSLLVDAAGATLRLVILVTLLAIVIGIATGILTAIRQYSGFDYVVTFLAFLFFSLPVFWAAVLLKDYGAIRFNNWIADPQISTSTTITIAAVWGLILQGIMGGDLRRRLLTAGVTAVLRSEEHTSELQSRGHLVCRLLLEKKKETRNNIVIHTLIANETDDQV